MDSRTKENIDKLNEKITSLSLRVYANKEKMDDSIMINKDAVLLYSVVVAMALLIVALLKYIIVWVWGERLSSLFLFIIKIVCLRNVTVGGGTVGDVRLIINKGDWDGRD